MKWWQTLGLLGTIVTLIALFAHSAVLFMRQQELRDDAAQLLVEQQAVLAEKKRQFKSRDQLIAACEDPEGKSTGKPLGVGRSSTFAVEGMYGSILCMGEDGGRIYLLSHRSYRGERGYWGYKYETRVGSRAP